MTRTRASLIPILLAGLTAAQTAPQQPPPAPLSVADIVLLLQMKVPRERIERFLEISGVNFKIEGDAGPAILKAGGDKELVGAIVLAAYNPVAALAAATATGGHCDVQLRVDRVADFALRAKAVSFEAPEGARPSNTSITCTEPLPSNSSRIRVERLQGRGTIEILEQPGPENDSTLRVRVSDPASGSDLYVVRASWSAAR